MTIPMRNRRSPIGLPSLVHIKVLPGEGLGETRDVIRRIKDRHLCSEAGEGLKLTLDSMEGYVECVKGENRIFFIALGPGRGQEPVLEKYREYEELAEEIEALIPGDPISSFTLRIGCSEGVENAHRLLKEYLNQAGESVKGMGVVRGCLLAMLEGESRGDPVQVLKRDWVLIPFKGEDTLEEAWRICWDMASLAFYGGQLNQLRVSHDLVLKQIDASEKNTQVRINKIFAGLRHTVEEIEPGELEGVLREVTTLFSSLSILVSTMRRDYIKAQSLLRSIETLFKTWNEEDFPGYPSNSSMELDEYRELIAPFEDYIKRVDALRVQLNTVLDAVRTYLGIQGQRMSVEEQASSKALLSRLVKLQEVLHKLEILIVAFYITEMGRLVFEAVAHEMAGVLTVAFIPIALLTSIGIRRILHKQ